MIKYVLGFMFSPDKKQLLLIEKSHPDWQKGKLNGIGGKVKEGESCLDAMVREFSEEVGVQTEIEDWEQFARMKGKDWECDCFVSFNDRISDYRQCEEELPVLIDVSVPVAPGNAISNVNWLINMALDVNHHNTAVICY